MTPRRQYWRRAAAAALGRELAGLDPEALTEAEERFNRLCDKLTREIDADARSFAEAQKGKSECLPPARSGSAELVGGVHTAAVQAPSR